MIGWTALRALVRVERRDLVRHRQRALLLMILVAIPVAAVAGGATLARIVTPTAEEQQRAAMGAGTLGVDGLKSAADRDEVMSHLPAGTPTTFVFSGRERIRANGRLVEAVLLAAPGDAWSAPGLAMGLVHFDKGRPPANDGEVALSRVLMAALGVAPGDRVALQDGAARVVTGVLVDPADIDKSLVLRTPLATESRGAWSMVAVPTAESLAATAATLRASGFHVTTRDQIHDGGDALSVMMMILGIIGLFEAALVMAAAFAVGLQRRRYEIGLLGSVGAPAFGIESALVGSALLVAVLGGLFGALVGVACAGLAHPWLDTLNRRINGSFEWSMMDLVLAIVLGMGAAATAVVWPARKAARVPVREALGGRKPPGAVSHTGPVLAFVVIALGIGLLQLSRSSSRGLVGTGVIAGPIVTLIGFGLLSPWLLERSARLAGWLPLGWRLAVRDAGRFRDRHAPVVTAVLAGMALSVAIGVMTSSVETAMDKLPAAYRSDQILVEGPGADVMARRLADELHAVAVAPLSAVYIGGQPVRASFAGVPSPHGTRVWVATGDDALLKVLGLEAQHRDFAAGRLLALDPSGSLDSLRLSTSSGDRVPAPPLTPVTTETPIASPRFVLAESQLAGLGLEAGPPIGRALVPWLLRLPAVVTPAVVARARALAATSPGVTIDADLLHDRPARAIYRAALVVCLLTGLGVVLVATALSAAESASDEVILHAVGAPPGQLRAHRGWRAAWLALVGCGLAVPVGMTMVVGLRFAGNFPMDIIVPWGDLAIAFVALPTAAFAGAWLGGGHDKTRLAKANRASYRGGGVEVG